MMIKFGIWISIIFYLISWGIYISPAPLNSKMFQILRHYGLILAFVIHSILLGFRLLTVSQWPETLTTDALISIAWLSIALLLILRERAANIINVAVVPVFAVVSLIIAIVISEGKVPALALVEQQSWLLQTILVTHIISLIAGHLLFALACISSILFLYQEHQIKTKLVRVLVTRFPSLGTLELISYRSTMIGFIFLTVGLVLGIMLSSGTQPLEAKGLRLGVSITVWFTYAMFLVERGMQGYRGKRIVIWPIIGFFIVLVAVAIEVHHFS